MPWRGRSRLLMRNRGGVALFLLSGLPPRRRSGLHHSWLPRSRRTPRPDVMARPLLMENREGACVGRKGSRPAWRPSGEKKKMEERSGREAGKLAGSLANRCNLLRHGHRFDYLGKATATCLRMGKNCILLCTDFVKIVRNIERTHRKTYVEIKQSKVNVSAHR
jgi:hypothetical protein